MVLGGNVFGWTADQATSFAVLDAFVESGGRSIDTADSYSVWVAGHRGGESESIIGEWLVARANRDDIELHTKVCNHPGRRGLRAGNIAAAVDDSLRRLRTDRIDLYYAHDDDPSVPQEEYVAALDALVRAGKVREVGASNFSAERFAGAVELARREGLTPFTVSQDHWNLVERDIESTLLPTLVERGVVELPYAGLAGGFLTGKHRPGTADPSPRADAARVYLDRPGSTALLSTLDELALAHGVSPAVVALAWLRTRPAVGAPIASARLPEQVPPLVASATLELDTDVLERLDAVSAATSKDPQPQL